VNLDPVAFAAGSKFTRAMLPNPIMGNAPRRRPWGMSADGKKQRTRRTGLVT
jgi:hypothetical protein